MTPLDRAKIDADGGSVLACVAICAHLGKAQDWPQPMRKLALSIYGLTEPQSV